MITKNKEDYLRAIYYIKEQKNKNIRSVDIAKYLNFSKPAVSEMLKRLRVEKYINFKPYSEISFTKKGLIEAQLLTYKHRVCESFLQNILGLDKKEIHAEAHKLEHAISDNVIQKMATLLNNPKKCPHGNKIPNIK